MVESKKRIDIVSLKMIKDGSIMYGQRRISSPEDAVELINLLIGDSDREQLVVIAVDTKHQPTAINVCSIGTLNMSIVHPREIFKMAILANASDIIIAHNHPSGDTTPSRDDQLITKRIKDAGDIIGITLLDHLIVGNNQYTSLKEINMC